MEHKQLLLLGDVARILDRRPHQIVYLLTSRQVEEPALRIGGRRVFTLADLERLKEIFHKRVVT